ncbi:nitrate ABC transporter substrate-binding protein [Alishewanella longhuensis]
MFQPALYQRAANALIAEGKLTAADFPDFTVESGYRPVDATRFISGKQFDGKAPNAYLQQFAIGHKD